MWLSKLSTFQTVVLAVFGLALVAGVAAFATFSAGPSGPTAELQMWGPYPSKVMNELLERTKDKYEGITINYRQVPYREFDRTFLEALASGQGPDLIFLPENRILKHRDKLRRISFETYSEEKFQENFAEAAEIFILPDGILGLPVTIDPLVMYWNREIHNQALLTEPPQNWSQLNTEDYLSLIERDGQRIDQSLVAFGGYGNVRNAKYLLATLMMQAGTPIIDLSSSGQLKVFLNEDLGESVPPAVAATRFYTQFADPSRQSYSWNNSLPDSRQAFTNTDLALYFGFASERRRIQELNPHLNFAAARMPERSGSPRLTGARLEALALTRQSSSPAAAMLVARELSGPEAVAELSERLGIPPIRRDLLAKRPGEAHRRVFYDSVFWARSWLDPDPAESESIFREMITRVRSGRSIPREAVGRADQLLSGLLGE